MGYRMRSAFGIVRIGEGEVGVVEQGKDVVGLVGHVSCGSQELFFGGGEHVLAPAEDDIQAAAVQFQFRFL